MIGVSHDIRQSAILPLRNIPGASRRALVNGVNRTLIVAKKEATKAVFDQYGAAAATLFRKTVNIRTASKSNLTGSIRSKGGTMFLDQFPHTPTQPGTGGKNKPAMHAKFRAGRGMSKVPGAFVIPGSGGKPIVVWRIEGKHRPRLARVPSIPLPFMMTQRIVLARIESRAGDALESRVLHEVAFELDRAARRAR